MTNKIENTWDYRIIGNKKIGYSIREVYYTNGKPHSWTENEVSPSGRTVDEFWQSTELYLAAFKNPILEIKGKKIL